MTELPTNLATEGVDPRFTGLDTRDVAELVRVMNAADAEVTDAVAHRDLLHAGHLAQDAHQAERGASQTERIRRAGRLRAQGEHRSQQVEAVTQGQQPTLGLRRHRVSRGARLLHLVQRIGDGVRLPPCVGCTRARLYPAWHERFETRDRATPWSKHHNVRSIAENRNRSHTLSS